MAGFPQSKLCIAFIFPLCEYNWSIIKIVIYKLYDFYINFPKLNRAIQLLCKPSRTLKDKSLSFIDDQWKSHGFPDHLITQALKTAVIVVNVGGTGSGLRKGHVRIREADCLCKLSRKIVQLAGSPAFIVHVLGKQAGIKQAMQKIWGSLAASGWRGGGGGVAVRPHHWTQQGATSDPDPSILFVFCGPRPRPTISLLLLITASFRSRVLLIPRTRPIICGTPLNIHKSDTATGKKNLDVRIPVTFATGVLDVSVQI